MIVPVARLIERVIVEAGPDIDDDWIAERAGPGDVVVTNDIPLADRVLRAGAKALAPNGRAFTENSIGAALALPLAVWLTGSSLTLILVTLALAILAVYKHRSNIQRLLNGTEHRVGSPPQTSTS